MYKPSRGSKDYSTSTKPKIEQHTQVFILGVKVILTIYQYLHIRIFTRQIIMKCQQTCVVFINRAKNCYLTNDVAYDDVVDVIRRSDVSVAFDVRFKIVETSSSVALSCPLIFASVAADAFSCPLILRFPAKWTT